MVTDILQRDVERVNRAVEKAQAAFKAWDPFSQLASEQQAVFERLRREVEVAEEQLNQAFLSAPRELRLGYLRERLMR